jgi:hypothetical protein
MTDDDTIPRLKAILGEHGFAQIEAFGEQIRKVPRKRLKEVFNKFLLARDPALGLPSLEELKKELFKDGA